MIYFVQVGPDGPTIFRLLGRVETATIGRDERGRQVVLITPTAEIGPTPASATIEYNY